MTLADFPVKASAPAGVLLGARVLPARYPTLGPSLATMVLDDTICLRPDARPLLLPRRPLPFFFASSGFESLIHIKIVSRQESVLQRKSAIDSGVAWIIIVMASY